MANEHYIPQLLLRRFASRVERGRKRKHYKYFLWHVDVSRNAVEESTREVGSSESFYGHNNTADGNLLSLETKFGDALQKIGSGRLASDFNVTLREFAWSLALRTNNTRNQLTSMFKGGLDAVTNPDDNEQFDIALWAKFENKLKSLEENQRLQVVQALNDPAKGPALAQAIRAHALSFLKFAGLVLEQSNAVESGIRDELISMISDSRSLSSPLTAFDFAKWELKIYNAHSILLGDAVMFAIDTDGNAFPPLKKISSCEFIVLPVSHSSVLVGSRLGRTLDCTAAHINTMSAQFSESDIFASTVEKVNEYKNLIGAHAQLLSQTELSELRRSVWTSKV